MTHPLLAIIKNTTVVYLMWNKTIIFCEFPQKIRWTLLLKLFLTRNDIFWVEKQQKFNECIFNCRVEDGIRSEKIFVTKKSREICFGFRDYSKEIDWNLLNSFQKRCEKCFFVNKIQISFLRYFKEQNKSISHSKYNISIFTYFPEFQTHISFANKKEEIYLFRKRHKSIYFSLQFIDYSGAKKHENYL